MGFVIKQSLFNTLYTYLGFLIGGIYTVLIVPVVFNTNPEHWGTVRYMVSLSMVIVPWVQLSIPSVIIRYFPIFKQKQEKEFLFFIIFWTLIGVTISILILILIFNIWFENQDALILENLYLIFPIIIGFVLFEIMTALSKSILKTTVPIFLKELFLRLNVMLLIILYWYKIINFDLFINLFAYNYLLITVLIFIYLFHLREFNFTINLKILFSKNFKPLYIYGAFSILGSGTAMVLLNIDTLMINNFLTLKEVAIYGPSIYIASSIVIPSRALNTIIGPLVSKGWVTNNISLIKDLYRKSAISPLILTVYIFLIIWLNIDFLMNYFGETFGKGKFIILFLSLGYVVSIANGVNGIIIGTSKFYRADLYFQIVLIVFTVIMNIIFIPLFGINGAALATAITLSFHNTLKSLYVYHKFKIHPFSKNTFYILIIGAIFFFIINYVVIINSLISVVFFSFVMSVLFWIIIYYTKLSEDINNIIDKLLFRK